VDYVLDGQQRLTSIFGVFQTDLVPNGSVDWTNVYFDFHSDSDAQDSQFLALTPEEVDPERHFPLNVLYDASRYGAAFRSLPENVVPIVDELHSRFKETDIPIQTFVTEERAGVAIVFERVNRLGVELDPLQLLSAWTWSDDFDLQSEFADLSEELAPFGFRGVGEDVTLLLRCCGAIVEGDSSPKTIITLNGAKVRSKFPLLANGLRGAIDFVRRELSVERLDNLPYAAILVPLAVFFASEDSLSVPMTDTQRRQILRWFWKSSFSSRYGRSVTPNLATDITEMSRLRARLPSKLDEIPVHVDAQTFLANRFNLSTVMSKTFILLLAKEGPRSLVSGQSVDLKDVLRNYNRSEFHHLYPQAFLRQWGFDADRQSPLANFCFINSIDNKILGGVAPSQYRERLSSDSDTVLRHAVCPVDELFGDQYVTFIEKRASVLAKRAQERMTD
jgi:hypothetical protein